MHVHIASLQIYIYNADCSTDKDGNILKNSKMIICLHIDIDTYGVPSIKRYDIFVIEAIYEALLFQKPGLIWLDEYTIRNK